MTYLRLGVLVAATVTTGWMAGLFWAYSVSVMPGLAGTDDRTFVAAMNRINEAIVNGWFMIGFVGTLLLLAIAVALHVPAGSRAALPWLIAATLLYVAVLGVTFVVNIPLNDALAEAGDPAAARAAFEQRWVTWNLVRTLTSTGSLAALGVAVLAARP